MTTVATLCFIVHQGKVLLLHKTEGRFGGGMWNGLGGKLKVGESPQDCVRREVEEESGLEVPSPIHRGNLSFRFGHDPAKDWFVHVFTATEFSGEPRPSDEGFLRWFDFADIPFDEMWEDDRYWLPKVLRGESVTGQFSFDDAGSRLLSYTMGEP